AILVNHGRIGGSVRYYRADFGGNKNGDIVPCLPQVLRVDADAHVEKLQTAGRCVGDTAARANVRRRNFALRRLHLEDRGIDSRIDGLAPLHLSYDEVELV